MKPFVMLRDDLAHLREAGIFCIRRPLSQQPIRTGAAGDHAWHWHSKSGRKCIWAADEEGLTAKIIPSCPYGRAGDVLWARECFRVVPVSEGAEGLRVEYWTECGEPKHLDLSSGGPTEEARRYGVSYGWKDGLYMPRWASRMDLEVVNVKATSIDQEGRSAWFWVVLMKRHQGGES